MYLVPSGHIYFALPHEHGVLDLGDVDQIKNSVSGVDGVMSCLKEPILDCRCLHHRKPRPHQTRGTSPPTVSFSRGGDGLLHQR